MLTFPSVPIQDLGAYARSNDSCAMAYEYTLKGELSWESNAFFYRAWEKKLVLPRANFVQ